MSGPATGADDLAPGPVPTGNRQAPGGPDPRDPPRPALRVDTGLTADVLDAAAALDAVRDPSCGGLALFVGVVRNHHEGDSVTGLVYEAWEEQAPAALDRVAREVGAAHPTVRALHVRHRVGPLQVGQDAVVVAASAPHRRPAIAAAEELLERLKAEVPIWKQEHLAAGGHRWPGLDTGGAPGGEMGATTGADGPGGPAR